MTQIGLLTVLLIHAALALSGRSLSRLALGTSASIPLGLEYPLGVGVVTLSLFVLSWVGVGLSAGVVVACIGLPALAGPIHWMVTRKQSQPTRLGMNRQNLVLGAGLVFLTIVASYLAVGRSYSSWDAMAIWSVKGYGIAQAGSIEGGLRWGEFGLTYPLNIPLMVASFRILGGDPLPGSKLVFSLFYWSLLVGSYHLLRRRKVAQPVAALGTLFLGTVPLVFEHGTIGYANLPFAAYLLLGTLCGLEGIQDGNRRMQLLSGILLGLACWTRPEGIFVTPIVGAGLILGMQATAPRRLPQAAWLLPWIAIAGSWLVFASQFAGQSLIRTTLVDAVAAVRAGRLGLESLYPIVRYTGHQLLTPPVWGVVLPVSVALFWIHRGKLRSPDRHPAFFPLVGAGIAAAVSTILHFYLVSFQGVLAEWLATSANRMFLPASLLLVSALIVLSGGQPVGRSVAQPSMPDSRLR